MEQVSLLTYVRIWRRQVNGDRESQVQIQPAALAYPRHTMDIVSLNFLQIPREGPRRGSSLVFPPLSASCPGSPNGVLATVSVLFAAVSRERNARRSLLIGQSRRFARQAADVAEDAGQFSNNPGTSGHVQTSFFFPPSFRRVLCLTFLSGGKIPKLWAGRVEVLLNIRLNFFLWYSLDVNPLVGVYLWRDWMFKWIYLFSRMKLEVCKQLSFS